MSNCNESAECLEEDQAMPRLPLGLGICLGVLLVWLGCSPRAIASEYRSPAVTGAEVYIISPAPYATVEQTFSVKFGLKGMGIAPAGIDKEGTGHHHLLVDLEAIPTLDEALPATEHIKHFGKGQTETTLTLPPGEHTLQLLLANYVHIPHDPPVISDAITITVE
jgi:hypothetical protein